MTTVTCHTAGCTNADVPLDAVVTWKDDDGVEHVVDEIICGVCGQPITDVANPPVGYPGEVT